MDLVNTLYDLIKSYHIFKRFDPDTASAILGKIQDLRLQIAILAASRQIFIDQLDVVASASGFPQELFFLHDDIKSVVSRGIAKLDATASLSITKQATREVLFTRESVAWQFVLSDVQQAATGQQIPFDFTQEIELDASQALAFKVIGETALGRIFVHGANLTDSPQINRAALAAYINQVDTQGNPFLPEMQLVPIKFYFSSANAGTAAKAVDGGSQIYSLKNDRPIILTEVSTNQPDCKLSLIDKGRDMTICDTVESYGIAGTLTNPYASFFPLPYPYLLPAQDRIQLKGINGSDISAATVAANTPVTLCFRGFTI